MKVVSKPIIDLAPLFDDVCVGEISLLEFQNRLDKYSKQWDKGVINLCYRSIPIFKSQHLILEADIKYYEG